MGVLNVTPDSFSDGGCFMDPGRAQAQALLMEEEGVHLVDVGGESSRPGSEPISAKEEIRRIRPVLKRLSREIRIPVSVDTYKYDVARMALDEGASLVNDIYALSGNKRLARLIARYKAGVVLMHMQGNPRTMQRQPAYQRLLEEISAYLKKAVRFAQDAGIPESSIAVDPGFGFGKTTEQNLEILKHLNFFSKLKCPILVGLSRKSFIGNLPGTPVSERLAANRSERDSPAGVLVAGNRLYESLAAAAVAIQKGAHILRVHEVLPHKRLAGFMDRVIVKNAKK